MKISVYPVYDAWEKFAFTSPPLKVANGTVTPGSAWQAILYKRIGDDLLKYRQNINGDNWECKENDILKTPRVYTDGVDVKIYVFALFKMKGLSCTAFVGRQYWTYGQCDVVILLMGDSGIAISPETLKSFRKKIQKVFSSEYPDQHVVPVTPPSNLQEEDALHEINVYHVHDELFSVPVPSILLPGPTNPSVVTPQWQTLLYQRIGNSILECIAEAKRMKVLPHTWVRDHNGILQTPMTFQLDTDTVAFLVAVLPNANRNHLMFVTIQRWKEGCCMVTYFCNAKADIKAYFNHPEAEETMASDDVFGTHEACLECMRSVYGSICQYHFKPEYQKMFHLIDSYRFHMYAVINTANQPGVPPLTLNIQLKMHNNRITLERSFKGEIPMNKFTENLGQFAVECLDGKVVPGVDGMLPTPHIIKQDGMTSCVVAVQVWGACMSLVVVHFPSGYGCTVAGYFVTPCLLGSSCANCQYADVRHKDFMMRMLQIVSKLQHNKETQKLYEDIQKHVADRAIHYGLTP